MPLHAVPLELHPVLRTHLREHFGDQATTVPHLGPTAMPHYLQPCAARRVWFHDVPPLATIEGAIVATDAGTTPVGMAMELTYEHESGQRSTRVASGLGTLREGEAMTLLFCVGQPSADTGGYRVAPDSESAVGALRTYHKCGHCWGDIHHLYAHILEATYLAWQSTLW